MKVSVMLTREEIELIEWALVSRDADEELKVSEAIAAILPKLHQALERISNPSILI